MRRLDLTPAGRAIARTVLATAFLVCLAIVPFAVDAYIDRERRVVVQGGLKVFRSAKPHWLEPANSTIADVTAQDTLRVRRIDYEKEYIAVHVELEDGRRGFIFAGDNFRLVPAAW